MYAKLLTALCLLSVVVAVFVTGADSNTNSKQQQKLPDGVFPLYVVSANNIIHSVRTLIKRGNDVNEASSETGATALLVAAQMGHSQVVEALLEAKGIEVDKPTNDKITPLWIASQGNRLAVTDMLIKAGANVNAQNKDGVTPLFVASQRGNLGIVKKLLAAGADPSIPSNDNNFTPLATAVWNNHLSVVKMLVEVGKASIRWNAKRHWTSLRQMADSRQHTDIGVYLATLEDKEGMGEDDM